MTTLYKLLHFSNVMKTDSMRHLSRLTKASKQPLQLHFIRYYRPSPTALDSENRVKRKDNVPAFYELIYHFQEARLLKICLTIGNFGTLITPLTGLIIYFERNGILTQSSTQIMEVMAESMLFLPQKEAYIFTAVITILFLIFNKVCTSLPIRIYLDKQSYKYIAIFLHPIFPWRTYRHDFTHIKQAYRSNILDNKRAKIFPTYFTRPTDYYKFCPNYYDDE